MNLTKLFLSIAICLCFLISCSQAKKASEVTAVYIPASNYTAMSCEELYDAAEGIRAGVPALESAVDSSASEDKTKEIIAWWLFAPAALFMEGNADEQSALAVAKGQLEAIRTAGIRAKCN